MSSTTRLQRPQQRGEPEGGEQEQRQHGERLKQTCVRHDVDDRLNGDGGREREQADGDGEDEDHPRVVSLEPQEGGNPLAEPVVVAVGLGTSSDRVIGVKPRERFDRPKSGGWCTSK
ncbi:MAG: hypothetical protein JNK82_33845 [Myxococcaceae bacterium]|nr:hypothetical protein [Myxococcaceae bacterium]